MITEFPLTPKQAEKARPLIEARLRLNLLMDAWLTDLTVPEGATSADWKPDGTAIVITSPDPAPKELPPPPPEAQNPSLKGKARARA